MAGGRVTSETLSPREVAVRDFWDRHTAQHGKPPSNKTICRSVPGIETPHIAKNTLTKLRSRKLIRSRRPRGAQ